MEKINLQKVFERLSQHSVDSVQSGTVLSDFDSYMHVSRPIEAQVKNKMEEIDHVGGGIIFLVGSAGDGKSHLISRIKQTCKWDEQCFYNDATASCSPKLTAVDTLKNALSAFKDKNIFTTNKKLLLAINLGKLNAFIEDPDVETEYKELVRATRPIFDDDDTTPPLESSRIKVIQFSNFQPYEFHKDDTSSYPVSSPFLSELLEKITKPVENNPFYKAYQQDLLENINPLHPLLLNYQLLSIPEVRNTICMVVIEAIIRFNLFITPREFLDFIYEIMVYPNLDTYNESKEFFEALLPTLLYAGGTNEIQKAVSKLDPLKQSCTKHDKDLSVLFTSYAIPDNYLMLNTKAHLLEELIDRTNKFYCNNGKDIERTTKFVFRLKHLMSYHSESDKYIYFLSLLRGVFNKDLKTLRKIYQDVANDIPRHCGTYYNAKPNMIPLNIQGGKYRMFGSLTLNTQPTAYIYNSYYDFLPYFMMSWKVGGDKIDLKVDYRLYSYLYDLSHGKLALAYENDKDIAFSRFVRRLTELCNCEDQITIASSDGSEMRLYKTFLNTLELQ